MEQSLVVISGFPSAISSRRFVGKLEPKLGDTGQLLRIKLKDDTVFRIIVFYNGTQEELEEILCAVDFPESVSFTFYDKLEEVNGV